MKVDRRDLQGNILRGYHFRHAAYLFVSVRQAEAGRRLLGELIEPVITEEEWGRTPPPWTLNVALTARGLKAVGLEKEARRRFPCEFRRGMRAKAGELGDVGKSAPEFWDKDLRSRDAHLLLTIYAPEADVRSTQLARWKRRVESRPGPAARARAGRRSAARGARALRVRRRLLAARRRGQRPHSAGRRRAVAFWPLARDAAGRIRTRAPRRGRRGARA